MGIVSAGIEATTKATAKGARKAATAVPKALDSVPNITKTAINSYSDSAQQTMRALTEGESSNNAIGYVPLSDIADMFDPKSLTEAQQRVGERGPIDRPIVIKGRLGEDGAFKATGGSDLEGIQRLIDTQEEGAQVPVVFQLENGAFADGQVAPSIYLKQDGSELTSVNLPEWGHLPKAGKIPELDLSTGRMTNLMEYSPRLHPSEGVSVVEQIHSKEVMQTGSGPEWLKASVPSASSPTLKTAWEEASNSSKWSPALSDNMEATAQQSGLIDAVLYGGFDDRMLKAIDEFTKDGSYHTGWQYADLDNIPSATIGGKQTLLSEAPQLLHRTQSRAAFDPTTGVEAIWGGPEQIGTHMGSADTADFVGLYSTTNASRQRIDRNIALFVKASGQPELETKVRKALIDPKALGEQASTTIDPSTGHIQYDFDKKAYIRGLKQRFNDAGISSEIDDNLFQSFADSFAEAYAATGDTVTNAYAFRGRNPLHLPDPGHWTPENVAEMLKDMPAFDHHFNELYSILPGGENVTMPPLEKTRLLQSIMEEAGFDHITYLNAAEPSPSNTTVSYIVWDKDQVMSVNEELKAPRGQGTRAMGMTLAALGLGAGLAGAPEQARAENFGADLRAELIDKEGSRAAAYNDKLGVLTGGIGHALTPEEAKLYPKGTRIPGRVREAWFKKDSEKASKAASRQAKELGVDDPAFKVALASVNFQLGTDWNKEHSSTWTLLKAGDWDGAAKEAARSKWQKQTPARVAAFQRAIRNLQ